MPEIPANSSNSATLRKSFPANKYEFLGTTGDSRRLHHTAIIFKGLQKVRTSGLFPPVPPENLYLLTHNDLRRLVPLGRFTDSGPSSAVTIYTSLPFNATTFGKAVRQHRGVENPLHWILDVTFHEDQSRARTKHAAQNLATLRGLALNLVKKENTRKLPVRRKRMLAALNDNYLERLLGLLMRLP